MAPIDITNPKAVSQELFKLRRSNDLGEALGLMKKLGKEVIKDEWVMRAIAWVYYDQHKKTTDEDKRWRLQRRLIHIINLLDDEMLIDKVWSLLSFEMKEMTPGSFTVYFREVLSECTRIVPSEARSYLLVYVLKMKDKLEDALLYDFLSWWDLDQFREEDLEPYVMTTEKGKNRRLPSLAEKAVTTYCKILSETYATDSVTLSDDALYNLGKEQARQQVKGLLHKHTSYKWVTYHYTKLLLACGETERAQNHLVRMLKNKETFWLWQMYSETLTDEQQKITALARGITVDQQDAEYMTGIYQELAQLFEQSGDIGRALRLTREVIGIREQTGAKVKESLYRKADELESRTTVNKDESESEEPLLDDLKIFAQHWIDLPGVASSFEQNTVLVSEIFTASKGLVLVKYLTESRDEGVFPAKQLDFEVSPGDILQITYQTDKRDHIHIQKAEKVKKEVDTLKKTISAPLKQVKGKSFGFIGGNFVEPELMAQVSDKAGEALTAEIIPAYDKNKEQWGWKVLRFISLHR